MNVFGVRKDHVEIDRTLPSEILVPLPPSLLIIIVIRSTFHRSIFGEDALANLSIEKPLDTPDATVTGHIRIRAKSQVILDANCFEKP